MLARGRRVAAAGAGRFLRLVVAAGLLMFGVAGPAPAHAEAARSVTPEAAATTQRASDYLLQLVGEINARRASAGTSPLALAAMPVNASIAQYVADLTPRIAERGKCFHGDGQPVAPGWDYAAAAGLGAPAGGEVLACPDSTGYWTPAKLAERWWLSESHKQTLYVDGSTNLVACGTFNALDGGKAFQTIACVTFRA